MTALHHPAELASPDFHDPAVYGLARRLFWKRFSLRLVAAGLDAEDAYHDVLLGLMRRARGQGQWQPSRGSLSTWLYLCMTTLSINLAESARCRRRRGEVGLAGDVADSADAIETGEAWTRLDLEALACEMEVPIGVLVAMTKGRDIMLAGMEAGMEPMAAAVLTVALEEVTPARRVLAGGPSVGRRAG